MTDGRREVELRARDQAESAYAEQQRQAVRAGWDGPPQPSTPLVQAFPASGG